MWHNTKISFWKLVLIFFDLQTLAINIKHKKFDPASLVLADFSSGDNITMKKLVNYIGQF